MGAQQIAEVTMPAKLREARAALVVSHPGHELCVRGWISLSRPQAFVLTDGSGRSGQSRINSTTKILTEVGAQPGTIYGRMPDQAIYAALLSRSFDPFLSLSEELAAAFRRERIAYVVGDSIEGYNPTHDVCRLLIDAAVKIANSSGLADPIDNFDFPLMFRQDHYAESLREKAIWVRLSDAGFNSKLEAMHAYPELAAEVSAGLNKTALKALSIFPEIAAAVEKVVDGMGEDAFRIECLRPVGDRSRYEELLETKPFYELYGERMVAAGLYRNVIRHRDHVMPLAEALWRHADG